MVQAFACTRYLITLSGFKTLTGLTALSTEAIQVYDEGKKTAEILLIIFGHSKIKKNEKYF